MFHTRAPVKVLLNHRRHLSWTVSLKLDERKLQPLRLSFLDLRGFGLSILERLVLEEFLLKHHGGLWLIVGTHEASPHRYLLQTSAEAAPSDVAIVMGIGGKPKELLHVAHVIEDRVPVLKRFTGGGTVVMDTNAIWTTLIGRRSYMRETNTLPIKDSYPPQPTHFPRAIMEYTATTFYEPLFARLSSLQQERQSSSTTSMGRKTLVLDTKSCAMENSGRLVTLPPNKTAASSSVENRMISKNGTLPLFQLLENDFVMGDFKIAGNAQTITKEGWLHHTSFLWDFDPQNMERYLTLPAKRPLYRQNRSHAQFLTSLQSVYPDLKKSDFLSVLPETLCTYDPSTSGGFVVDHPTWPDVLRLLDARGGINQWYATYSRTKLMDLASL